MGVRGLTSFIYDNERKFLKPYKLHDCYLVIDGNCLATVLYLNSVANTSYFGGDYDKYAMFVENFFKELFKCSITPLVIFDGGYEVRKLKTVVSRNKSRVISLETVSPSKYSSQCTPLMMRYVFREKLRELSISYCQSDFEADNEIAAVGRKLNCPILSNDSDFFIFDVLYIPLNDFSLTSSKSADNYNFIDCKIYQVDNFLSVMGGLPKQLLPLLAVLLGNDYISRRNFATFYSQMKLNTKKNKNVIARVTSILEWLKQETFDSALSKILGHFKKYRKKALAFRLACIIQGYIKVSSPLDSYLLNEKVLYTDIEVLSVEYMMEKYEKSVDEQLGNDTAPSEDEFSDSSDTSESVHSVSESFNLIFPPWFLECSRKGLLPSCLITLRSLKNYFALPQMEDYSLPGSIEIALPVLLKLAGIVLGKSQFHLYSRSKNNYVKRILQTVVTSKNFKNFPNLFEINSMLPQDRKLLFIDVFEGSYHPVVELFPSDWQLFVISLIYWGKNMKEPQFQIYYLHSIIFMLIGVKIIGSKIGFYRNKRPFMQRYASKLKDINNQSNSLNKSNEFVDAKDFADKFNAIPESECLIAFESVLHYFHFEESIRCKPKVFSKTSIHAYAQLQVCLDQANCLNSLLLFPFESCKVYDFYNSTLLYNITINFKKRPNILAYMETFFSKCPSILNVYKQLFNTFTEILGFDVTTVSKRRKKKKSKGPPKELMNSVETTIDQNSASDFSDEDNSFYLLSKVNI